MKYWLTFILVVVIIALHSCDRNRYHFHPIACFTVDKDTVNVGDTITFTNCSDYDGGPILTKWYFGDTTIINNNAIVQHIYNAAGQYMVFIQVGDKYYSYSGTKTITIQ